MTFRTARARRAVAGVVVALLGLALAPSTAGAAISTTAFCANVPANQSGFTDIGNTAPHKSNIECLKGAGVTSGVTATTYGPTLPVSRAAMATFIANMIDRAGVFDAPGGATLPALPAPGSAQDFFSDDNGNTHEDNINRLRQAQIIGGTSATTFSPNEQVGRDQMATFIAAALAFLRGSPLTVGNDAFSDDNGNTHEANINRLANADVVDGTSATTYNPAGKVSRSQMASFIIQGMALLHQQGFITAVPGALSGIVTSFDKAPADGGTVNFTVGNQSLAKTYDTTNDQYFVDGAAASQAVFENALTVGDVLEVTDDNSAEPGDADIFRLTNVDIATRRSGTVGNVHTGNNTFAIIDRVTGVVIGGPTFTYTGDVLQIAGAAATEANFDGAINEGDTIAGTVSGTDETWNLTNQTVTGLVTALQDVNLPFDGMVAFRIGNLGDDYKDDTDDRYTTGDEPPLPAPQESFTIGGESATAQEFEQAVDEGDTVAYSRTGGVETFALTNAPPPPVTGTATDGENNANNTIELAVGTQTSRVTVNYTGAASYRVDGTVVTEAEFETALTPGDNVTYQDDNPDTAGNEESISLTNANLTGRIDSVDTANNQYDVENDSGVVLDADVTYGGTQDLYFRNGSSITIEQFETLLTKIDADTTVDDSVTVVRGSSTVEHRLQTDETF